MKTVDHSYEQALIMHDNVHIHVIMIIIMTPSNQGRPRAARAAKKSGYKTKLTTCTKNIFVVG